MQLAPTQLTDHLKRGGIKPLYTLHGDEPLLVQSKWARGDLFYPPYGKRFDQVMGLLKRWL